MTKNDVTKILILLNEIAKIRAENQFLNPSVQSESRRIDANIARLIEIKSLAQKTFREKARRHLRLC